MLEEAVKASLWQLAVYDEEELVAYIRLVRWPLCYFCGRTFWYGQITNVKALERNS